MANRWISAKDRFLAQSVPEPASGCWLWHGPLVHGGYGHFRVNRSKQYAHRFAYELYCGPIPAGLRVRHKCDNPGCVNPDHLILGTQLDNMADCIARGRFCRGEDKPWAKLTEAQVLEIRTLSLPQRAIAALYGVGRSTIRQVLSGQTWAHV